MIRFGNFRILCCDIFTPLCSATGHRLLLKKSLIFRLKKALLTDRLWE